MNRIEISDPVKFEEIINRLEAAVPSMRNTFQSQMKTQVDMSGNAVWKGKAQEALHEKHEMLSKNFEPAVEGVEIYIRFLRKTLEDYKALDKQLEAKAEESSNQLNVNS